jgi:hypothetical protein
MRHRSDAGDRCGLSSGAGGPCAQFVLCSGCVAWVPGCLEGRSLLPGDVVYIFSDCRDSVRHGLLISLEHSGEGVEVESSGSVIEAGGDRLGRRADDGTGDCD